MLTLQIRIGVESRMNIAVQDARRALVPADQRTLGPLQVLRRPVLGRLRLLLGQVHEHLQWLHLCQH